MASELETKLRQLAKNGELTYLSMVPVAGLGEYGCTFVAQIAPASRFGHVEGRDGDPVKALVNAIDALPKSFVKDKPQRKGKKADEQITSADVELWDLV
jgi:hypothetical protein